MSAEQTMAYTQCSSRKVLFCFSYPSGGSCLLRDMQYQSSVKSLSFINRVFAGLTLPPNFYLFCYYLCPFPQWEGTSQAALVDFLLQHSIDWGNWLDTAQLSMPWLALATLGSVRRAMYMYSHVDWCLWLISNRVKCRDYSGASWGFAVVCAASR